MNPTIPGLTFLFQMRATLGAPQEFGRLPNGLVRRIIPVTGGTFEGPGISGLVLAGGADWQTIAPDGIAELDARYTLKTDTGHYIYVANWGIRRAAPEVAKRIAAGEPVDPSEYYMRTSPRLEASAPELAWVRHAVFVCSGARLKDSVVIDFYRLD